MNNYMKKKEKVIRKMGSGEGGGMRILEKNIHDCMKNESWQKQTTKKRKKVVEKLQKKNGKSVRKIWREKSEDRKLAYIPQSDAKGKGKMQLQERKKGGRKSAVKRVAKKVSEKQGKK